MTRASWIVLLAAACAHVAGSSGPPARLISTSALAELFAARDSDVTVIDVRNDLTLYLASHIPRAVTLNPETLRAAERGVPNKVLGLPSYAALFSRLGLRRDWPVVIYSAGETRNIDATYLAWILQGLGMHAVYVLDGGFGKWSVENRPVTRRYPVIEPTAFASVAFQPDRATLDDVKGALNAPGVVIVDARNPDQYAGRAGAQLRRGHIPGAINHFWQDDLATADFATVWKTPDALRASYGAQGITPDKKIIAYCNGGLESSHVYFALHNLLGYPSVQVYDGSFTEWAERAELPVKAGNDP
ncbi:MAG TPA: sulfurtransferase [Gemmatimonadales bacterium]|nr:sulfurtransferase [Gemmatimonadales bacterium]